MRQTGIKKTCRFCKKWNDLCPIKTQVLEDDYPAKYGMLIPTKDLDLMGAKLAIRFKCYEKINTGEKQWIVR